MRIDIDEGAEKLPTFGYGRIKSPERLKERYFTVLLFGYRFFYADGFYRGPRRTSRFWHYKVRA